jgi:parvulin-like peptidyl-prolyl isomerase
MASGGPPVAATPESDPALINDTFTDVDAQAVSGLFGPDFARSLFDLPAGAWAGPIKSAYGVHLVQVTQTREAMPQRFEDVRQAVTEDWRRRKNVDAKQAYLARLREKYGVLIEAPAASRSATQTVPKQPTR